MKKYEYHSEEENNILNDPDAGYERAEINLLKEGINRSYTERFLMTTRLYKIQQTLKKATITYKPYTLDK
jgi:hypothetical protein